MNTDKKITVISLGGSLIIPQEGFNLEFLRAFKKLILSLSRAGQKFIIVCGGGYTARNYQKMGRELGLSEIDLDWVGVYATRLNANFMRLFFGKNAHGAVVDNPTKKIVWKEKILIAAGWKPADCSTDFDAVKLAKTYGADTVLNLSNVDYVYTKDPKKFKDAVKLEKISWPEFRKIVGNKWSPGANLPFDPAAAKEAEKLKLKVCFVKGSNLSELQNVLNNKKFKGTVIYSPVRGGSRATCPERS